MIDNIIPFSDGKKIEDAPLERQNFFKRKMLLANIHGKCGWCGKTGKLWRMNPRGVLHHNRMPDGLIVPLEMCYSCCERELAEPNGPNQPEADSHFRPIDISFRRDRSNDIGNDGRFMDERELRLYITCNTTPEGKTTKDVGFIVEKKGD